MRVAFSEWKYSISAPAIEMDLLCVFISNCSSLAYFKLRGTSFLALLGVLTLILSVTVFQATFVSIWCFFAALLSLLLFLVLKQR